MGRSDAAKREKGTKRREWALLKARRNEGRDEQRGELLSTHEMVRDILQLFGNS